MAQSELAAALVIFFVCALARTVSHLSNHVIASFKDLGSLCAFL
jgi:hypothetical protein